MSDQLDRIEELLSTLISGFSTMESNVSKLTNEVFDIKQQLDRIEHNQTEDIISSLQIMNAKVESCATKEEVSALARIQGEQQLRLELMRKAE